MQEKIKTKSYIDKKLESESDINSDSDNYGDNDIDLIMKNKFKNVNQIVMIIKSSYVS